MKDTTDNSITLAWSKPAYDGGSDVTGYMVEKKLTDAAVASQTGEENQMEDDTEDDDEDKWMMVASNIQSTRYTLINLSNKQFYLLRVSAINKEGVSDPELVLGKDTV